MAHGFTVQGGLGAGASIIPHESSAHSVLVPDTELLFTAQFHRAGPDLVLTGRDGQHHLIPGYFASEHHPALVAPNGAHLSPDTVDLLAGSAAPGHYAQAQPTTPPDAIGKIEKVVGDVTVVRNGATVALHVGDAVFKSDVVQAGASSSCGISFPDGTVLNLVANTRMALNDYAYDANSNSNGALFTLVEGTFAFVAGKVAHSGDMKIATPVATMGIRGTTGVVQEQPDTAATITANAGGHTYTFAVVPDIGTGVTGMWDVFLTDANGIIQRDANGNPIVLVTVSQSGYVTYLTPQGLGQPPLVETVLATNSQYAFEQEMLQQLFRTLNPANLNGNGNNGSSSPPPPFELPNPIPQLFEDSGKPFTINVPNGSSTPTPTIVDIVVGTGPLTVVIWTAGGSGPWSSGPSWLGGAPPTSPQEVEILNPVKVTTDGADSAAGLVINAGAILNIVSGTSFTIYDFIHGGGTIALNSSGSDPTLFIHGGVTLAGGGTIKMLGPFGEDNILGVPGTGAVLVNVDYTIEGTGTIGGGDGNLTFQNFGIVNANNGCLIVDTGNQVYNDGLMEATADLLAATTGTLQIKDSVVNAGTVQADGAGTAVKLSGATFNNLFWVVAKNDGSVAFTNVAVTNEAVSATDPAGGTINAAGGTITFNGGSIANGNLLEATNGGTLQLENLTVTNSAAGELSIVGASSELDLMNAKVLGGLIENCGKVVVTAGSSILHGDTVTNSGTMTVEAGASLTLEGDTTLINERHALIEADGDHAKVIIDIDTDENVNSGTIKAINGGEVDFNINIDGGSNHGLIEAGAGGTVHFFQTNNSGGGGGSGDHGGNYGTMEAADGGVLIFDGGLDNSCRVEAVNGGTVDLNKGIKNHAGTVEAIGSDSVIAVTTAITVNGDVINNAKIEATGFGAQINISNSDSSENAGTIIAENHGTITLSSVQLENDHCATVEANGATINYTGGTITNDGTFKSDHQGAIFIGSNTIVHNDGTGVFEALSNGFITFSNSTVYNGVSVSGASGGTIEACCDGSITFADSTVYNGSSVPGSPGGIIQASCGGTVTFSLSCTIYNNNDVGGPGGVIEALRGGTVDIDTSTVFNDNGTIEAIGCGAVVNLFGTDIYGGTLASSDGGVIEATFARSTLQDVTILGGSVLDAADTGLGGSFGLADTTTLAGGGTVTFEGAGEFLLGGDIVASTTGTTLKNASTIAGAGQIGAADGKLTLDNELGGTIDANEPGFALTIHTGNTVTNAGTLEATTGGPVGAIGNETLKIEDAVDNSGTITSSGAASIVQIDGDVTNEGTGQIGAGNSGTVTFGAVTVTNDAGGDIGAFAGGQVTFDHSHVENHGHIGPNGGTVTFDHSVVENDSAPSEDGNGGITADGGGTITFDHGCVTNNGAIEAQDGSSITFEHDHVVNTAGTNLDGNGIGAFDGGSVTFTDSCIDNTGFIRASVGGGDDGSAGTVYFTDSTVNNAGGTISAVGAGAIVQLADTTIKGGTLFTDLSGLIEVIASDNGDLLLDGSANAVTVQGVLKVEKGAALDLAGSIIDNGTIEIVSGDPDLVIDGTVTLNGSGSVNLDGTGSDIIGASTGTNTLDNKVTIKGAGEIGGGGDTHLTLDNQSGGIVNADINNATLTIDTGNILTNTGTLEATNGGTLQIDDSVANESTGIILATGTGSTVSITFDGGGVNNCGLEEAAAGGTLNLTDDSGGVGNNSGGTIKADAGTVSITGGVDNNGKIEAVDGGTLTITIDNLNNNEGGVGNFGTIEADHGTVTIVATVSDAIVLNSGNGTIEAIDCGVVSLEEVTVDNSGMIKADGHHAVINLDVVTINGGTLATTDGGIIETVADSGISTLSGVTINDGSILKADTGSSLDLECTTAINGTVTFEGCGTFMLDAPPDAASIVGGSGGGTLDIAVGALLTGSGTIGNAGETALALSNNGTVDADGVGAEIDIETANYTTTNKGLLEATHGGTLAIESDVNNDCGTIGASGAGSTVQLVGGINIAGGTLTTGNRSSASDGVIEIVAVAAAETILDGSAHAVTIDGYVQVDAGASLALDGTIDNEGTIDLASACGPSTNLVIQTDVTLQGGGQVTLTDCGESAIGTNGSAVTLTNVDNTISGAGTIGDRTYLTLVNQHDGTVDANICGAALTIDTSNTVSNAGLLEATNGGTLEIDDKVCNTACGVISASGHDSVVQLDGVTITGGTLETSNGGVIDTIGTSTLSNVTIADGSTLEAGTGATFLLEGTTTVSDPVIFKGCGTFELSGKGAAIVGSGDGADLHNYATIVGAGAIGSADLSLTNECGGVIDATGCLTINLSSNDLTNHGTMEATGGGELILLSPVVNYSVIAAYTGSTVCIGLEVSNEAIGQVSGEVIASGHCAVVDLSNATIIGGTVASDKGGLIQTVTGADDTPTTSALEDVTVSCGSDIKVADQTTLILEAGTTISGSRLSIESSGGVEIVNGGGAGGATLTDVDLHNCGQVTVDNDTTLTLSGTTIHGGEIDGANATAGDLASAIDVTGDSTFCDVKLSHGDLTVEGGVTLSVEGDTTTTTFDGVNVVDSGIIHVDGGPPTTTLLLENATTISGDGTLSIGGTGILDVEGSATLDGLTVNVCSGGIIEVGETTSGSILTLDDGTTVTGGGTGQLTINFGNTLDVEKGTSDCHNGATLDGVIVQDNGAIDIGHAATGAILTLDDGTTLDGGGSAAVTIHAGSTLDVENGPHGGGATLDDVHVTDCGAFDIGDVACGAILTLEDDATITGGGAGTMTIHANNTVDVESIGLNGGATLDGVQVTDNGALDIGDVATGAILTLDDGTSVSGCGAMTIKAGGTLDVDSGTTTIDLGGTISNHGTLEASSGGTLDIVSHVDNACGALLATSGGVLDVQSCISGGTATIHGATLEFDVASNVNVTFDNGSVDAPTYGTLVLGDPADFCGTIANFTGTCPDASHSDTIDLADFKACNTTLNATYNGDDGITTLCVVDTTDDLSATLKLIGQYSTDNFTIASDGKGGIDIFDPPTTGSTDAPATATAAPGNDHVAASAHQNGLDPAASPANAAGFGGDQDSAAATTAPDGAATPPASQLALAGDTVAAPPSATSALGGNDLAGFGDDPATVPALGGVNGGAVTMQLTAVASPIAAVTPNIPVLASEHLTNSTFVDGSDIAKSEVTPSTLPTAPTNNEHTVAPALATSPALASASFGGLSNDSFAFHPNLGSETAQTTDAHASDLAHSNLQIASPALAAIVPEFHQEFAFDAIHQDVAAVAATVDQFHQMAANTTLLH